MRTGKSPCLEAGKACDLYGSLDGHDIQQSDAEQAYTQSKLGGDPTWAAYLESSGLSLGGT